MQTRIVSTGMFVPKRVVTNFDLEKMMDTTDEWIQQRSGIKERRWISPGETTLSMGTAAAKQALERAKLSPDDIDLIIFGCLVSDYIFPGTGVLIQNELGGSKTIPALDIRNQCSGFLYALTTADAFIKSGMYKRILIVASEIHSTSLNQSTEGRDIAVLFGDGAGAMIVEASNDPNCRIIDSELHSEGKNALALTLMKPSSNDIPRVGPKKSFEPEWYPRMDGKMVFKNAVVRMTEVVSSLLEKNKLMASDIDFVIAHQANARINQMVLNQLGIPDSKTHNTLDHYGNTTMATIPITFDEAVLKGKIKRGDKIIFVGFGAGFTWGANLLQY
jgi:3-oxoacyl-[acyl-carrier-protein] synthase-3